MHRHIASIRNNIKQRLLEMTDAGGGDPETKKKGTPDHNRNKATRYQDMTEMRSPEHAEKKGNQSKVQCYDAGIEPTALAG
jgi:hypothetical protein